MMEEKQYRRNHYKPAKQRLSSRDRATRFKTQNDTIISWFLRKWRQNNCPHSMESIRRGKAMNRTALNSNVESTLERSKLLTNWSNNEPSNTIQLRDFHENQDTKEPGIFVARARTFLWPILIPSYWYLNTSLHQDLVRLNTLRRILIPQYD